MGLEKKKFVSSRDTVEVASLNCFPLVQTCILNWSSLLFSGNIYFLLGQIHSPEVQQRHPVPMVGLRTRVVVHPLLDTLSSHRHDLQVERHSWYTPTGSLFILSCSQTVCDLLAYFIHDNLFCSLPEDLHPMYSIRWPVFWQTREESPGTDWPDLTPWYHGILVTNGSSLRWTECLNAERDACPQSHDRPNSFLLVRCF